MNKKDYRLVSLAIISGANAVNFVAPGADEKRIKELFSKMVGHPWRLFKKAHFRVGKVEIRHVSNRRKLGRTYPKA